MDSVRDSNQASRGYENFRGIARELASESTPSWPPERRAASGAPNVIVVLLDDMGFSDVSPYGSEIDTPHAQALADAGYCLTNFHSAPVCSPARAALLTGLNPHRAGFGNVAHSDPGYPGYSMEIAENVPTIAESFRAGGYTTFMVGKWHLTKESQLHDGADKSSWPLQRGFDSYYGSMDGFTTLFHPHRLIRDNTALVVNEFPPDYYLTDDLTDQALRMMKGLRASEPEKPFFLYFAHQAVHGPLQAKTDDLKKYRGRYKEGWDSIRAQRFARQLQNKLFPPGTVPADNTQDADVGVPAWESLTNKQQQLFARYMEVYAAAVDNVDQNLGRLIEHLKASGEYENTIIAFTSDNGGTGEGGPGGTRSYFSQFVSLAGIPGDWQRDVARDPDDIGGPRAFVHYPRGWAYASNTPFRLFKFHTFEGGVRVPLMVSWPAGLPRADNDDGVREHYAYMTDLGPTLLKLADVTALPERHGHMAPAVDGVSFDASLRESGSSASHREQYSEYAGHRAYVAGPWKIVTQHRPGTEFSDLEWQLYHLGKDPAETHDRAADHPDKTAELAEKWRAAAWRNTVFPLNDDGSLSRNRPSTELVLEEPVTLYPGTPTLERFRSAKLTKLRSFDVAIDFSWFEGDAGVLVSHGDQGGGYALYVEHGCVCFAYNQYGVMHRFSSSLTPGQRSVLLQFNALPEVKWRVVAELDGAPIGELKAVLQLVGMAPFTGISIGVDRGSPVDWNLHERHGSFAYTGALQTVRYLPGTKAFYNAEQIVQVEQELARIYD
ncbi:arylsulfatase [Arthrobacter castelli]|uniref:arylsulfatase n=1 Tax=Arthrobacter castelli TaxID=271431 RepID=UPI000403E45C|nr:arylsulfatase [Arthrobacter castelli]